MKDRKAPCSPSASQSYQPSNLVKCHLSQPGWFGQHKKKFAAVFCPALHHSGASCRPHCFFSVGAIKTTVITADIPSPAAKSPKTLKRKQASQQISSKSLCKRVKIQKGWVRRFRCFCRWMQKETTLQSPVVHWGTE